MITWKHTMIAATGGVLALVGWIAQTAADVQIGSDFQTSEAVTSIRVELQVGADGADLDEPIALDLGLGFPLWLAPVGQAEGQPAPFGAVPQTGPAGRSIRAGEQARFEFLASGDPGQDALHTTQQLLAGTHVSDISRVAFTSRAEHGWILAGYTIQVNGKLLASNNALNVNAHQRQEAARERLAELRATLEPQQTELNDLRALVATGLATDDDRSRLTTLETTLAPQTVEQRQLERQLQGAAPWFTEADFRPAWRRNGTIESVRVTVVTAAHSGADTRNYVYFRTGGHKYLLGAPAHPMSPASGPQEFNVDLALAPLNAGDVRGYALGMLAHGEPCGEAPDRWHPERLRVEIDGRVVYDSEDNTIDRTSLTAIRLVPPAHYELAGQIHENTPIARETFVWEAGTGAGLDLVHGGAEPLPAEGDADYPAAEPGLLTGDELAGAEEIPWHAGDVLPFPGEEDFGPMWDPGLGPWEPGWEPGWGPGWEPGPDWFDMAMFGLLEHFGLLPDWVIPDPVGNPPQLETVTVDTTDQSIHWTVTGDASQIDHFVVDVLLVRPDLDVPYVQTISDPVNVPAAQRSLDWAALTMHPLVATFDEQTRHYRVVRVTIVPTTPIGVDPGFSPALPMRRTQNPTQLQITPTYVFTPLGGLAEVRPLLLAGEPATTDATAWVAGQVDTHNGLVFGNLSPQQHHVVARTIHDGDRIRLRFTGSLGQGRWRLIAMIGFQGALETATSVDVEANCLVHVPGDPTTSATYTPTVHLDGDPMAAPTPLRPLMIDIDTQADVGVAGPMDFRLSYSFTGTNVDPRHPPMLVGLRLIEAP